jgi:HAE1 family hydrophobic/amphiphilic exporter-1
MKFFVDRPVATAMIFLSLLVLGVYSFLNTPLELEPNENYPQVDIQTSWPGVPPEIIQTKITAPLEEVAATVKGVQKMTSTSAIGLSQITLEFSSKTNMEFATLALRENIDQVRRRSDFPAGVRPIVQAYVPEDFRVRPFLSYTVSGNYSLQKLRELVKDKIEFGLGSVSGVGHVGVSGGSDPEVRVTLDKAALKALNIEPYQVMMAIRDRLSIYPSGRVVQGTQEYLFKFTDAVRDMREIGETVVGAAGAHPVRVRDVARVGLAYGDVYSIRRINGRPTIGVTVIKEKGTNTLQVSREVKRKVEEIKRSLPGDLDFKIVDDESQEIRQNLNDLYRLAAIITAIVFLMIFVVLRRWKPSLLILSSIAFSVVITFLLIYAFKISLNMLTLGALALGFGMFVDDAIVVFDNILRQREKGLSPREAAVQGPKEVFTAVLASTLTTVSVFCCFPFFQGRLKIFYLPLAIVMTSALLASLVVSFTVIPALSPRLLRERKTKAPKRMRGRFDRVLRFFLRHPIEVVLVVAAILFGTYKWFRAEVTIGEWFRWYSKDFLYVSVGMPPGTDISRTDTAIRMFETKVMEQPYAKDMNADIASENASIRIGFPPDIERSYRPYALKEELIQLATQFAGLNINVSGFDQQYYYSSMGTGTSYSSQIKFFGYNLKKLKEITADLEGTLKRNPRIKEVRTVSSRYGWWRGDTFENILKIDKAALRQYDVDPLYLYYYLQTLLRGQFGSPARMQMEGKEIIISVKFPDAETLDMRALRETLIRTRGGEYLRLGQVASFDERPIAGSIDRENQQFQQTIMWEFRGPSKAEERYRKSVFASLHLPAGFSAVMEESYRMTEKEKGQITMAIVISLALIFMILASLYESLVQPFLILLAVPLELIGVFVAFIVAGAAFDASAYIGVVLLGGIVVKNAILLVDHMNLKRRQGRPLLDAVVEGTRDRLRPIIMTTGTTVFGIMPMLLLTAATGRRQIWNALALCTAGGLVSSTLFILAVVPIFYYYVEKWRVRRTYQMQNADHSESAEL